MSRKSRAKELGAACLRRRQEKGLGVREVANLAGVAGSTVSRFERGFETSLGNALSICAVLDVPLTAQCEHVMACRYCGYEANP